METDVLQGVYAVNIINTTDTSQYVRYLSPDKSEESILLIVPSNTYYGVVTEIYGVLSCPVGVYAIPQLLRPKYCKFTIDIYQTDVAPNIYDFITKPSFAKANLTDTSEFTSDGGAPVFTSDGESLNFGNEQNTGYNFIRWTGLENHVGASSIPNLKLSAVVDLGGNANANFGLYVRKSGNNSYVAKFLVRDGATDTIVLSKRDTSTGSGSTMASKSKNNIDVGQIAVFELKMVNTILSARSFPLGSSPTEWTSVDVQGNIPLYESGNHGILTSFNYQNRKLLSLIGEAL